MDKLPLMKSTPPSYREWALFGLRWIMPVGLLLYLLGPNGSNREIVFLVLAVSGLAIVTNLTMLIFLMGERWSRVGTILAIVADSVVTIAGIAATGASMVWLALIPITVAGF